ncbi:MAG: hypothetical protein ABIB43_02920 [archaeon]
MDEKVIWQPKRLMNDGYEFGVDLDKDFAFKMINAKVGPEAQHAMYEKISEYLKKKYFNYPTPLDFYEDTAFISGFYIYGNGVWLATDRHERNSLLKNTLDYSINYYSHNVDNPGQAHALMGMVDVWVTYSEGLLSYID